MNIYLIDDQPIANFITKKLLENEGFSEAVEEFTDATQALEKIESDKDAFIFLDLNMPVMNGWEFLEALKKRNICHRIVILTSSTSSLDRQKASNYPCVIKYMEKPMSREKLADLFIHLKAS